MTTSDTSTSPVVTVRFAFPRWLPALLVVMALVLGAVTEVAAQDKDGLDSDAAPRTLVPEPATLVFVGVAGLALFRRRVRHRVS